MARSCGTDRESSDRTRRTGFPWPRLNEVRASSTPCGSPVARAAGAGLEHIDDIWADIEQALAKA